MKYARYAIGGKGGLLTSATGVTVIDILPEDEFPPYGKTDKYVQADVQKALPKLPSGNIIHIGRVLRCLGCDDEDDYAGYLLEDEIKIEVIQAAVQNILAIAHTTCVIEIVDHLEMILPAAIKLCCEGFELKQISLLRYPDEDYPAEYRAVLIRKEK